MDKLNFHQDSEVLAEALLAVGNRLGLSDADIAAITMRPIDSLFHPLDPTSKSGQPALLLIRIYQALHSLTGGDPRLMLHWLCTGNRHTGGVPSKQIRDPEGIVVVASYLEHLVG